MLKKITLILVALLSIATFVAADDDKKTDVSQTITISELRDHMFFLASDELEGRYVGSAGYKIAAQYGVTQFRAAGLKPILKDKDGKPTFLQKFTLVKKKMKNHKPWVLTTASGENKFDYDTSYLPVNLGNPAADIKLDEFVFLGYGIKEPKHSWNDFEGLDLKGKTVLILGGAPMMNGKPVLPKEIHRKYVGFMGLQSKASNLTDAGVKAVIFLPDTMVLAVWNMFKNMSENQRYSLKAEPEKETSAGNAFFIKRDLADALFAGQKYSPMQIKEKGMEGYKPYTLDNVTLKMGFEFTEEDETDTWNVVGVLEGTDPALKDQYVTLGAHLDHVAPQGDKVCNGADDNASGSIGVMEIAEAMAMAPGKRPIIFILYGAEEAGLLGSKFFVNHPPVDLEQITVNINLDMIGRTDHRNRKTRAHYVVGSERLNSGLRKLIEKVNAESVNWPLDFENSENMIGNSDQKSFLDKGIPVAFFFSGVHRDLHRPTDDAEKIDYEKMQKISQLACRVIRELADKKEVKLEEM